MNIQSILISIAILFGLQILYFKIADRFNIIDKPNERSSHSRITTRGGGIIFPIGLIMWYLIYGFSNPWFMLGLILISIISFLDDILTLSTKVRLTIHLLSVLLLLYELGFETLEWWYWPFGLVLVIGWLNTFNFMDGINGITVLYSLSIFAPIWYVNSSILVFPESFLWAGILVTLVFGFFNVRKKAKSFAGDVGSVSMGFLIAFLLVGIILHTGCWEYILLVSVYGVDSLVTILQRLVKGENIFEAHRTHLYQYMANELKMSHVSVSIIYAIVQSLVSLLVILIIENNLSFIFGLALLIFLAVAYIYIKKLILNGLNQSSN